MLKKKKQNKTSIAFSPPAPLPPPLLSPPADLRRHLCSVPATGLPPPAFAYVGDDDPLPILLLDVVNTAWRALAPWADLVGGVEEAATDNEPVVDGAAGKGQICGRTARSGCGRWAAKQGHQP